MHIEQTDGFGPDAQSEPAYHFSIEHYAEAAKLPLEAFIAESAAAFLLHYGRLNQQSVPLAIHQTVERTPPLEANTQTTVAVSYSVLPLRKTERSPETPLITLGRAISNDLVVPDVSVSHVHALFEVLPDQRLAVTDMGSLNGTSVNNVRLARHALTPLAPGVQMHFGTVKFAFLYAQQFCQLVRRLVP